MQNIDKILKVRIQEQLAPAKIVEVISEEAEDHDGDPILRIEVIFQAENNYLDPKKILGLPRCLHQPLHKEYNSQRYPVFSFMTPEEAEFATA